MVVLRGVFPVDLDPGAELAHVFVDGGLEEAGAPNSSSGRVVLRPSLRAVPSSITVPA